MKKLLRFGVAAVFLIGGIVGLIAYFSTTSGLAQTKPQDDIKMPEVTLLGKDAKLGQITFNHVKHNGGTYSIDETGPIRCIECHHTAQPASEIAKHPPLKTSWPADRSTSLTAELFAKGSAAAGIATCRDCHARVGQIPKLIAAIPEIKHEASTALITLTNQQAFHRTCVGCHTEVAKTKKGSKGPTSMQCMLCHKKAA